MTIMRPGRAFQGTWAIVGLGLLLVGGCARLEAVGKAPPLSPVAASAEFGAASSSDGGRHRKARSGEPASLWSGGPGSLLGDRRAASKGDILTVVVEIDERAEFANRTSRSRTGSESMGVPEFLGIPQALNPLLPDGATLGRAVETRSASGATGDGSIRRRERLTLRLAATVLTVLPNGHLMIEGKQEVRVNSELRELTVAGIVRPEDVSRRNEITYDKISAARIAYGGRGTIMDVQRPRWGQEIADIVLPF